MPETSNRTADVLTVTPSRAPTLLAGIGLLAAALLFIYLSVWATGSARQQQAGADALCQQLRDQGDTRVETLDLCRAGRGNDREGLGALPAVLAVACGLGAGYSLFVGLMRKDSFTFDRPQGVLRHNGQEIVPLNAIREAVIGRSGRSYALDLTRHDGERTRLGEYLTVEGAVHDAERIAAYLGVPVQRSHGMF